MIFAKKKYFKKFLRLINESNKSKIFQLNMTNIYRSFVYQSDLIDDVIKPEEGSIRETRIDGSLYRKHVYMMGKWINACKYLGCKDVIQIRGLCKKHFD
jgi:hypothetical protein